MKLDGKSALIGLVMGILITFCVGASIPASQKGKYEIAATDKFVLRMNTQTGEIKRSHVMEFPEFKVYSIK